MERLTTLLVACLAALAAVSHTGFASEDDPVPYAVVLGIAQDGGFPQAGCARPCCRDAWADPARRRHVACLGIVDPESGQRWLIEATPENVSAAQEWVKNVELAFGTGIYDALVSQRSALLSNERRLESAGREGENDSQSGLASPTHIEQTSRGPCSVDYIAASHTGPDVQLVLQVNAGRR